VDKVRGIREAHVIGTSAEYIVHEHIGIGTIATPEVWSFGANGFGIYFLCTVDISLIDPIRDRMAKVAGTIMGNVEGTIFVTGPGDIAFYGTYAPLRIFKER
jgi:hypothetical protein